MGEGLESLPVVPEAPAVSTLARPFSVLKGEKGEQ